MAQHFELPHVSIIFDPSLAKEKMDQGDSVVYGDAVNEPILMKANVDQADIIVVSVGNTIPSMAIIEKVRNLNKHARILVRAKEMQSVGQLYKLGADQVLPEKLELAIDLFHRVLTEKLYSSRDINRMLTHIRNTHLGEFSERDKVNIPSLLDDLSTINISAITTEPGAEAIGKTIRELEIRSRTGSTLLAIKRGEQILEHPAPHTNIESDDVVYLMGDPEQVNMARELFSNDEDQPE
jgi:CPA2 family monovalent cation:H+ antiporter-2